MKIATARRHPRSSLFDSGQFLVLGSFAILDSVPRNPRYPQIPTTSKRHCNEQCIESQLDFCPGGC